jgi:polar amino acid transport system substrate-binding protein
MFSKKFDSVTALILMVLMVFVFAGCQQKEAASQSGDDQAKASDKKQSSEDIKTKLDAIKAKGKIVLGTAADYPPYEFHKEINGEDQVVGFDIDIAKSIAKDLGVKLEIKDMKFDGLLAALVADKIDFIVAGMVPKPERKKSVDFSIPYYEAEQRILVKKADADKFKTPEDFKGLRIGAQKSTVQEDIANTKIPDAQVKSLSKITDLVLELKNNKVDAIVLAKPVADAYAKQNDDLVVPDISFGKEDGVAVAVNKGNAKLLEEINKSLQKLLDNGDVDNFITNATKLSEQE